MLSFKDKKITVMGLGLHGGGVAAVRFLAKKGAEVTVTDLKTKEQLKPSLDKLKGIKNITYVLGEHRLEDFRQADMIAQNPDVPRESVYLDEAKKHKIPIENEASLFFKLCPAPIIAVTGTRGKSTTASLIYNIFKKHNSKTIVAGNIRDVVMLDVVDKIKKNTPVVLELSSWQLEVLDNYKISPHIGVLTNIMVDHLNRYKNFQEYIKAKMAIYKHQAKNDFVIINRDNEITNKLGQKTTGQRFWFSQKFFSGADGSYVKDNIIYFRQKGKDMKICPISEIKLPGRHNLSNVLAAVTAAKIEKVPTETIVKALKTFKGLANRQELVRNYQGIKYINDTTATTPDATIAALNTFYDPKKLNLVLLAGGKDKKLDYRELAKVLKSGVKVKSLILFEGTATEKLLNELARVKYGQKVVTVKSMAEAFIEAKKVLTPGDIFLLSPGAASFGIFINEYDRGNQFNSFVVKIK